MLKKIREYIKRIFTLYDIEDLQVGAWCGCCGTWKPKEIVPKNWQWTLCKDCGKVDY